MVTELLTLPDSIPGLLLRGSPVWHPRFGRGIMLDPADPVNPAVFERVGNAVWSAQDLRDAPGLALNLTDAMGKVHAVMWAADRISPGWCWWELFSYFATEGDWIELVDGQGCHPVAGWCPPVDGGLSDAQALRDLCLHVAGLKVPRG